MINLLKLIQKMIFNSSGLRPTASVDFPVLTILTVLTIISALGTLIMLIQTNWPFMGLGLTCTAIGLILLIVKYKYFK
ncbi:MAG: hypothetical protein LBC43_01965 [Bifidobacteriaceae bacterium]|nr:hypothetical protein [Bifidobacteriaceae bacterium]